MKKNATLTGIISLLIIMGIAGACAKNLDKPKMMLEKMVKIQETLASNLEKATTSAAALEAYRKGVNEMSALIPELNKLDKEYPINRSNPPPELKEQFDKLKALQAKSIKIMTGLREKFKDDPNFASELRKIAMEAQNKRVKSKVEGNNPTEKK